MATPKVHASKSHINKILRLKDVLVPTTNDTIALWHFDKHLQSTNGIRPIWNLGRIAEGKFGNGVLVQENTENLLLNSSFQMTSNWSLQTNSPNGASFTTNGMWGKINIPVGDSGYYYYIQQYVTRITPANTPVTFSIVFNNNIVGRFAVRLVMFVGATAPVQPNVSIDLDGTGGTKTVSVTAQHTSDSDNLRVDVMAGSFYPNFADVSVEFTSAQLEQKAYVTPFIESSILNEKLSYLMPPPVAVSCYFKLASTETRSTVGDDRVLLWYAKVDDQGNYYDNVSSWKVYIPGGSTTLRLECTNAQQALSSKVINIASSEIDIYDNQWHFMCIRFNETNMEFMVDDLLKDISSSRWNTAPSFESQKIGIGCDPESFLRPANVYVDELRCDTIYISTDEIEAWKASNRPFYDPYDYSITEMSPIYEQST